MTVVKDVNYLVEDLTFLFFKGKSLKEIQTKLIGLNSSRISSYYNDLSRTFIKGSDLFSNNFSDPRDNPQNSWFDIEDNRFAMNVKYGYESSANSRIRDITKGAVHEINCKLIEYGILSRLELYSYDEYRNQELYSIGQQVKKKVQNIEISSKLEDYIKFSYLVCMNLITNKPKEKIYFIKYGNDLNVEVTKVFDRHTTFDVKTFLENTSLRTSTNAQNDPHKKTIQLFFKEKGIGFFEIRSNNRVMLHLRQNESHWCNFDFMVSNLIS